MTDDRSDTIFWLVFDCLFFFVENIYGDSYCVSDVMIEIR